MALTKAELAERLFEAVFNNRRDAKEMIELIFEQVAHALERGDEIKLSGFGNFKIRKKNARPGRNPRTGSAVMISERRVVTFHPGQKLRERVAKNAGKNLKTKNS